MIIGVLALQGNFAMHQNMLVELDVPTILVKYPHELEKCDGLIIPGGESSTMSKLIDSHGLRLPLVEYSKNNSIFGTCAGMILLSSTESSHNLNPLNILTLEVNSFVLEKVLEKFEISIYVSNPALHTPCPQ